MGGGGGHSDSAKKGFRVPCALCPGFHVPGPSFHVQAFISQNIGLRPIQIGSITITLFRPIS